MIAGCLTRGECGVDLRAIYDEDVGPPVIVVVENRDTSSRSFNDVFLRRHAAKNILHGKAGFLSDIREIRNRLLGEDWRTLTLFALARRDTRGKKKRGSTKQAAAS